MIIEAVASAALVVWAAIGLLAYRRLFWLMSVENPRLFRDLGRPSLGKTSLKTSRLVQRYIWSQRKKDGRIGHLARFLIGYFVFFSVVLLVLAVILVAEAV